jgi:hypothetical protein
MNSEVGDNRFTSAHLLALVGAGKLVPEDVAENEHPNCRFRSGLKKMQLFDQDVAKRLAKELAEESGTGPAGDPWANAGDEVFLSPSNMAAKWGVPLRPLQSRLLRYRQANPIRENKDWLQVSDRGPRDPEFIYRISAFRPILYALRACSERAAKKIMPR